MLLASILKIVHRERVSVVVYISVEQISDFRFRPNVQSLYAVYVLYVLHTVHILFMACLLYILHRVYTVDVHVGIGGRPVKVSIRRCAAPPFTRITTRGRGMASSTRVVIYSLLSLIFLSRLKARGIRIYILQQAASMKSACCGLAKP